MLKKYLVATREINVEYCKIGEVRGGGKMEDIEQIRQKLYQAIEQGGIYSMETQKWSNKFNETMNRYYMDNKDRK